MPDPSLALSPEYTRKLESLRMRLLQQEGQAGSLRVDAFVPATGIGKFDAEYRPDANRLDVVIKVRFDFVEVGPAKHQSEVAWTPMEQLKFISDALKQAQRWSDRYLITCARPGWERFHASVHVRMELAEQGHEYYLIRVRKVRQFLSSGGIAHGEVPHVCSVNNYANEKDTSKSAEQLFNYKEGILRGKLRDSVIDKSGDFVEFAANSTTLALEDQLRLTRFATFVGANRPPEMASVGLYAVGITGKSDSFLKRGLSKDRVAAVVELLNARVPNVAVAASADEPWAKEALKLLATRARNPAKGLGGVLLVVRTPQGAVREVPLNYVVMMHEIGHMLGLPDEYLGVRSSDTQSKMRLDAVVPSTYIASQLDNDGDHERLRRIQDAMVTDLVTANVRAPGFMGMRGRADGEEMRVHASRSEAWGKKESEAAKKFGRGTDQLKAWKQRNPQPVPPTGLTTVSTSIMHSGEEVLPAHYITLWSALSKITAGYVDPDQWKIVPTGKGESTLRHFG